MRRVVIVASLLIGCATTSIASHEESYRSDTILVDRLLEPLGVEPPHGQITVAMGATFADKLLRASLSPNVLTLSVAKPGPVWKEDVHKLAFTFENEVRLNSGHVDVSFLADKLSLRGDLLCLHGAVSGHGGLVADLKLFSVGLQREVDVRARFDDELRLHIERAARGWQLRLIGPPIGLHVDITIPALKAGIYDLVPVAFSREVPVPTEIIPPFDLPLPAPSTVQIGPATIVIALSNLSLGAREGLLWVAADVVAQGPAAPLGP